MKPSPLAVAAVLASLSAPALAADPATCSVCDDPTQPAHVGSAPAFALAAAGGEAEAIAAADPTQPRTGNAAPAVALRREDGGAPVVEQPAEWAPKAHYALEVAPAAAPAERVATVP